MKRTQLIFYAGWGLWIAAVVVLMTLHALHLRADFPNYSPWMDYSKYTDEGWYGKAAIEHYVLGSWYVHGDFNPSVALPVLPALEWIVFRFTGVSLVAARLIVLAVFALDVLLSYYLVRTQAPRWAAMLAATLLAVNPFLYAFSRLAILELLLVLFLLVSWLLALRLAAMKSAAQRMLALTGIGLLLCLMVLTKTTAIFIAPSTLFLIWHSYGYKWRDGGKAILGTLAAAGSAWGFYYLLCVHPHYVFDYHYLFAVNKWEQPATLAGWIAAFWYAFHGIFWIGSALCILALALLTLSALLFRGFRKNPLLWASLLAIAGYVFFIGWHNNMQPRYYQVMVFPVVFIVAIALHSLLQAKPSDSLARSMRWLLVAASIVAIAVFSAADLKQVSHWIRHPQYSWINSEIALTRYIDSHPNGNRLLLSISGDDITLATHLPAICDDFGTWDLPLRIHRYRPGWYAAWNEIDPGTLLDLNTQYSLEKVASFPAFDDPDRNQLILYKLHPLPINKQTYDEAMEEAGNAGR